MSTSLVNGLNDNGLSVDLTVNVSLNVGAGEIHN